MGALVFVLKNVFRTDFLTGRGVIFHTEKTVFFNILPFCQMKLYQTALLFIILTGIVSAQCSDAGVCSIHKQSALKKKGAVYSAGYSLGLSEDNNRLTFHTFHLGAEGYIFADTRYSINIPIHSITGALGSVIGLGDIVGIITVRPPKSDISFSGGVRLATGNDDKEGLPQQYQPGLGTNDLLLGLSYTKQKFVFAAGYQKSSGRSKNRLTELKRGDDLLLRMTYSDQFDESRDYAISLLYINHLTEMNAVSFMTPAPSSAKFYVNVNGSDQKQLNLLLQAGWVLDKDTRMVIEGAFPFFKREINLDGLSRAFTLATSIHFAY